MQFRRRPAPRVQIDIAPLVDVVFLLVIFFAATTTFLEQSGIRLELPASSSTATREVKELAVFIGRDGQMSFQDAPVTLEQLEERLPEALRGRDSKIVVLRADRETPHGAVVNVMDVVRDAGAEGLTVATRSAGQ